MNKSQRFFQLLKGCNQIGIIFLICICQLHGTNNLLAQTKQSYAVLSMDTNGIDPVEFANMVRLELEKNISISVLDRYDMADILKKNNIQPASCFGKNCLVEAGKVLKVDKILSGSATLIGEKIVINLRIVDVNLDEIVKSNVVEYIRREELINRMVAISVNNLFNNQNDPTLVDQLTLTEEPIAPLTSYHKLNGPRIGLAYVTGDIGEAIQRSKNKGGYDGYPVLSQFGYQFEIQYLGAGNFLALFEILGMVSGMEQQMFIPTLIFTNGFRINKQGWEIAFGPTFSLRKQAKGFYDTDGLMGGSLGEWYLVDDWLENNPGTANPYENLLVERMDSRGDLTIGPGWVWAIGKTFHSGYLNIPINVYISPKKEGWYIGLSVGFNVSSKTK